MSKLIKEFVTFKRAKEFKKKQKTLKEYFICRNVVTGKFGVFGE